MEPGGRWIKVVLFVLGIVVLSGVTSVLLDPGLGTPDTAPRGRHPAGFSIALPRGWGATPVPLNQGVEMLRVIPERVTGRSTIIAVSKLHVPPKPDASMTAGTFQGQPAYLSAQPRKYAWYWTARFQRAGQWYEVQIASPVELDVPRSPYMPFLESFRLEPVLDVGAATAPAADAPPDGSGPLAPTTTP